MIKINPKYTKRKDKAYDVAWRLANARAKAVLDVERLVKFPELTVANIKEVLVWQDNRMIELLKTFQKQAND